MGKKTLQKKPHIEKQNQSYSQKSGKTLHERTKMLTTVTVMTNNLQ